MRGLTTEEEQTLRFAVRNERIEVELATAEKLCEDGRLYAEECPIPDTCPRRTPHLHFGVTANGREALACLDALRKCVVPA